MAAFQTGRQSRDGRGEESLVRATARPASPLGVIVKRQRRRTRLAVPSVFGGAIVRASVARPGRERRARAPA